MGEETARERQSRVARSGGDWEKYVYYYLTDKLKGTGIEVILDKSPSGRKIKERSSLLWRMLSIPVKASTVKREVWGDIDLVAVKGDIPIAIISCKTSLHGRLTETLFYGLLFKAISRIKVVLATSDKGAGTKGKIRSEWGTPENPSKARLLAESYLDGVYVENVPEFCDLSEPTVLGGIVRPLSELPEDIKRWAEEAEKFTYIRKGGLKRFV